jgi:hypothetical protein
MTMTIYSNHTRRQQEEEEEEEEESSRLKKSVGVKTQDSRVKTRGGAAPTSGDVVY